MTTCAEPSDERRRPRLSVMPVPGLLKRGLVVIACAAMTTSFAACESTEQESTQIQRQSEAAQQAETAAKPKPATKRHTHGRSDHIVHASAKAAKGK